MKLFHPPLTLQTTPLTLELTQNPDFECLADVNKVVLLHDPALPKIELCFKALPHYHTFIKPRDEKLRQRNIKIPAFHRKYSPDNQPIPIKNEHELAHLYLEEIYNKLPGCNILELNLDAILTILSKASCFPEVQRKQASKVRGVRNKWLCSNMDHWTEDETKMALSELVQLASLIPARGSAFNQGTGNEVSRNCIPLQCSNLQVEHSERTARKSAVQD